ncbi:hypothetical protein [Streptacidiphilus sp. P02-A3a]|uniref:hypothetical protein n=1 Tax=Streptacidiphilus sp. P02-A3a TaxID=2704468 RepID=UPI0015FB9D01|nr:hypothetical protein [Streptacidiphilus sp. P02-A3a]QMU70626.1 hypothetical protein GXP74_22895 [Streptacidiphilus sp. P02-A3a]
MDGFFRWYRSRSTERDLLRQIAEFSKHAIEIEHPVLRKAVLLNIDGDQVLVDPDEAVRLACMHLGSLNLEWWLSADVDLTCEFSAVPLECEIQTYYFSGLTNVQRAAVGRMLLEYVDKCAAETVGYILDEDGRSEEFDWNGLVLYGRGSDFSFPNTVVMPKESWAHLGGMLESASVREVGDKLLRADRIRLG